jgi:hypothetical protein
VAKHAPSSKTCGSPSGHKGVPQAPNYLAQQHAAPTDVAPRDGVTAACLLERLVRLFCLRTAPQFFDHPQNLRIMQVRRFHIC